VRASIDDVGDGRGPRRRGTGPRRDVQVVGDGVSARSIAEAALATRGI
jgi:hypothetical protein